MGQPVPPASHDLSSRRAILPFSRSMATCHTTYLPVLRRCVFVWAGLIAYFLSASYRKDLGWGVYDGDGGSGEGTGGGEHMTGYSVHSACLPPATALSCCMRGEVDGYLCVVVIGDWL